MGSARALFGNRAIVQSEGSWALAAAGTWIFTIVLALYSYYEHGPAGVGLAVVARTLPAAVLAGLPLLSEHRWPRRRTVMLSAVARFAVLEAIALVVWTEAPFALFLALAAAFEIAGALHQATRTELVLDSANTPEDLHTLRVGRSVTFAGFAAGAVASALLLVTVSVQAAFATAGLVFALVATVAWTLPGRGRLVTAPDLPSPEFAPDGPWAVDRQPWTRLRVGLFGAGVLVEAMLELLLVVVALHIVHLGDGGVGWLRAAFAGGGLMIAATSTSLLRTGRLAGATIGALLLAGLPLALIVGWSAVAPAVILIGLVGAGYALLDSSLQLLTQRLVPPVTQPLPSLERYTYPAARALGAGLGTWLVLDFGNSTAVVIAGLVLPVVAILAIRPLIRVERTLEIPERVLELLGRVPLLAGLSPSTIENLALRARSESFQEGDTILSRDQAPDRLFVIVEGTVAASEGNHPAGGLGPGAHFGESAIFRAGCESTVTALTPVTALTVTRGDFIGALGGATPAPSTPWARPIAGLAGRAS